MSGNPESLSPSLSVHQLKVTLDHLRPPIWRRVVVPSELPLSALHVVIQVAMGWEDDHLHQFDDGNVFYASGMLLDDFGFRETRDEAKTRIIDALPAKSSRLLYEYDMGDGWKHRILVEAVRPAKEGEQIPVCLAGKRACPPEDCGGVWGYANLLDVLADPTNPEYEDMMEWSGPIDPEAFDVAAVNERLAWLFRPVPRARGRSPRAQPRAKSAKSASNERPT